MKTIGIIGGLSWLSSIDYYRYINEMINQRLGDADAGKIILYSVNFGDIKRLTLQDDWPAITAMVTDIAQKLQQAGADCILVGANTMHRIAPAIQEAVDIPLIHVAEETAKAIQKKGLQKVGLLGTKFTMELSFYPEALARQGISLIIPGEEDRQFIHDTIYHELGANIFLPATKDRYLHIIRSLQEQGAEGVILGCTEIPLLIKEDESPLPVFNTTLIHATAAVEFALA